MVAVSPRVDGATLSGPRSAPGFELTPARERLLVVAPVALVGGQRVPAEAIVVVERIEPCVVGEVEPEAGAVELPPVCGERLDHLEAECSVPERLELRSAVERLLRRPLLVDAVDHVEGTRPQVAVRAGCVDVVDAEHVRFAVDD